MSQCECECVVGGDTGAAFLARTDADSIPAPGWIGAVKAAFAGQWHFVAGRNIARDDEPRQPWWQSAASVAVLAVRRLTTAYGIRGDMRVATSNRRLARWGLRATVNWYLRRMDRIPAGGVDIR